MSAPAAQHPLALVVEDDEHIAMLLRFILERNGWQVAHAGDGRRAQDFIANQPAPAVVLLDLMLPHVDGIELAGQLRRQPGWERVPVLMLSAKAQERDIVRALDAGANDYLLKPFQPEELLARLRRLAPPAA